MKLLESTPPPFSVETWARLPYAERAHKAIESFGRQGNSTPLGVFLFYAVKLMGYVLLFLVIRGVTEGAWNCLSAAYWLAPIGYQKAVAFTMLFEVTGFGCGSGPLTGRFSPLVGAFRHWLRPGTTKLPLFPDAPLIGGHRRRPIEVLLYAALLLALARTLSLTTLVASDWYPILALLPVLGVLDRPIFLAARSEHYWVMMLSFAFAPNWVAGAMIVQLAMWFFAGISKLNAHFPSVVAVMTSNSPVAPAGLKRRMYVDYPADMRPSATAARHAVYGTALELGLAPVALAAAITGHPLLLATALGMALFLHLFILSNVPIGVPLEWNLMMLYGAFFFFAGHPGTTPADIGHMPLFAVLIALSVGIPIVGNFLPERVPFLLSMRYYAGNWPVTVCLIRRGSEAKFDRLRKAAAWPEAQLRQLQPDLTDDGLQFMLASSQAFRLLHLHGRAIHSLVPELMADVNIEDYLWLDGEIIAGLALGWNFGDGHLHNEALMRAIQAQCGFEKGDLRCLFLEAQALGGRDQAYRLYDACDGELSRGRFSVAQMQALQPWPSPLT